MDCNRHRAGVTLVEMLAVISVIVILTALVVGIARRVDDQGKERSTENVLSIVDAALQAYYDSEDKFPQQNPGIYPSRCAAMCGQLETVGDCRVILEKINDQFYVAGPNTPEICDAWGRPLDYQYNSLRDTFPRLRSAGADKRLETKDDLSNK